MELLEKRNVQLDKVTNKDGLFRVFVYGTLMAGESNHGIMQTAVPMQQAYTEEKYNMYNLGCYPAVVKEEEVCKIKGEVAYVNKEGLQKLDWLEGFPGFYACTLVETSEGTALMYSLYKAGVGEDDPAIKNCDWRAAV